MAITKKDVEHISTLARLYLTEEEKEVFTRQLGQILEHFGKLSQLDTSKISPTTHVMPVKNVFREDEVKPSVSLEKALSNAPKKEKSAFVIPKIV